MEEDKGIGEAQKRKRERERERERERKQKTYPHHVRTRNWTKWIKHEAKGNQNKTGGARLCVENNSEMNKDKNKWRNGGI